MDSHYCFTSIHMGCMSASDTEDGRVWCTSTKRGAYFLYVALNVLWGGRVVRTEALLQFQMVRLKVCWTLLRTERATSRKFVFFLVYPKDQYDKILLLL